MCGCGPQLHGYFPIIGHENPYVHSKLVRQIRPVMADLFKAGVEQSMGR